MPRPSAFRSISLYIAGVIFAAGRIQARRFNHCHADTPAIVTRIETRARDIAVNFWDMQAKTWDIRPTCLAKRPLAVYNKLHRKNMNENGGKGRLCAAECCLIWR